MNLEDPNETPETPIFHLTDEELKARRKALLEKIGMTHREIMFRATTQTLETEEQWNTAEEIGGIDFLLGLDNDD